MTAVTEVSDRLDRAEDLLQGFLDRFYWIKDHPDYFDEVKAFLAQR
jgi:hypothetical protein